MGEAERAEFRFGKVGQVAGRFRECGFSRGSIDSLTVTLGLRVSGLHRDTGPVLRVARMCT